MITGSGLILLAALAFVSFTVQALTGFGGTITALVLTGLFFPIELIIPAAVSLSLVVNAWFVFRRPRDVDWRTLGRYVVPWMGAGTLLGYQLASHIEGVLFRQIFGVFVVFVASRELIAAWRTLRRGVPPRPPAPRPPLTWLSAAGLVHGVYATGGPPLVYALSRAGLDKSTLRATLCAVWLVMDSGLTVAFFRAGRFAEGGWTIPATMFPMMLLAIGTGSWLHSRLDADRFRLIVYGFLLVLSLALIFRA